MKLLEVEFEEAVPYPGTRKTQKRFVARNGLSIFRPDDTVYLVAGDSCVCVPFGKANYGIEEDKPALTFYSSPCVTGEHGTAGKMVPSTEPIFEPDPLPKKRGRPRKTKKVPSRASGTRKKKD